MGMTQIFVPKAVQESGEGEPATYLGDLEKQVPKKGFFFFLFCVCACGTCGEKETLTFEDIFSCFDSICIGV